MLETMEMVPIGKIEEVTKKEFREQRNQRYGSIRGRSGENRKPWKEENGGTLGGDQ